MQTRFDRLPIGARFKMCDTTYQKGGTGMAVDDVKNWAHIFFPDFIVEPLPAREGDKIIPLDQWDPLPNRPKRSRFRYY